MNETEVQDPVVEEVVKEEVSPNAELTTPPPDGQEIPEEIIDLPENRKTVPKERFDQVWARTKKNEARLEQLQSDLQREREERIRLEERSKVKEEQTAQKEMSWAELETGIADGRWSRDQAQEYKDKMTEQRLERKFKEKQAQESSASQVLGEIRQYQELIPDVMTHGSENRAKYEREFQYLIRNGSPNNHSTELAAVRAAFGSPEVIKARQTSKTVIVNKEPLMETHTSSRSTKKETKPYEDTLQPHVRAHYEKLMRSGVVKRDDWKAVKEIEDRRAGR